MSLTYPTEAARETTRLGIEAAFSCVSLVFLVGAAMTAVLQAVVNGSAIPWLAIVGLAALCALAVVLRRWRRLPVPAVVGLVTASAVAVGTIGWSLGSVGAPQGFVLGAALIAATAIGSNADRWTGAVGTIVGYLLAQLALLVVPEAGVPNVAPLIIAIAVAVYYVFLTVVRRAGRSTARRFDDAALANWEAAERRALEQRSRALVHDTVLSELVALGLTKPGRLSAATRESILESLDAVRGPVNEQTGTPRSTPPALEALVARFAATGLHVAVSGDPSELDEIGPTARSALMHAIGQTLANVRNHAGVDDAEVSVVSSGDRLVVTVVDEGVGFVESQIPPDRFGFRESIRGRLEAVGGEARILSSPGAGTSIVLTVPLAAEEGEA